MITIYHLERSRSDRIIWLCEELRLKYKIETFKRQANQTAEPAYKALHPLGRAPLIKDGDVVLAESGAIVEYIIERHGKGKLRPKPKSPDYPRHLMFLHFAEGSMMAHFFALLLLKRQSEEPTLMDRRVAEDIAFVNAALAQKPYFGGAAFSGADILMTSVLRGLRDMLKRDLDQDPNIRDYLARMEARPAFKKARSFG